MFDRFVPLEQFLGLVLRYGQQLLYLRLLLLQLRDCSFGLRNLLLFLAFLRRCGFLRGVRKCALRHTSVGFDRRLTVG